jgi:uncharacterized protein (DUF2236 family)
MWLGGVGLMAPILRERLGLTWTRKDARAYRLLGAATRGMTPLLPRRAQIVGPAQLRMRRRAIARGPLGPAADAAAATTRATAQTTAQTATPKPRAA